MENKKYIIFLAVLAAVGIIFTFTKGTENKNRAVANINTYELGVNETPRAEREAAIYKYISQITEGNYEESYNLLEDKAKKNFKNLEEYTHFVKAKIIDKDKMNKIFKINTERFNPDTAGTGRIEAFYSISYLLMDDKYNYLTAGEYLETKDSSKEYVENLEFEISLNIEYPREYKIGLDVKKFK
ncbi:MAG: hypothetical protein RR922_04790 [Clostridia bacterium]